MSNKYEKDINNHGINRYKVLSGIYEKDEKTGQRKLIPALYINFEDVGDSAVLVADIEKEADMHVHTLVTTRQVNDSEKARVEKKKIISMLKGFIENHQDFINGQIREYITPAERRAKHVKMQVDSLPAEELEKLGYKKVDEAKQPGAVPSN